MDPGARDRLRCFLSRQALVLTTAYSGCGFFEVVVSRLFKELGVSDDKLVVYSACDLDENCQRVLLAHQGSSSHQHVHGDLCERWGKRTTQRLYDIQSDFAAQVQDVESQEGCSQREAVRRIGTRMLDVFDAVLRNAPIRPVIHCVRCNARCNRKPPVIPGAVYMNAAGSICVEFSARGKGAALTGKNVSDLGMLDVGEGFEPGRHSVS